MTTRKLWGNALTVLLSLSLMLTFVATARADDDDPPGRVARLSFADGQVSFQPAGEGDWVTATPNRPMVTGDNLWADEASRAEVHIGSAALRLADQTGITFLELNDRVTQIRLAQGALFIRVRHVDDEDTYEVNTPNLAFRILQPGEYRLDVSPEGDRTTVTVWHGRGGVTGGGFSYTVVADQKATFTGTDELNYDLNQVPDQDGFDRWAFERDDRENHSDSANYVSREMTGYEDLDEYGHWSYVAGYGECWAPVGVSAGWAPYRYGHWAWISPYGWTWVGDEPWAFAPFHYGRWASVGGGWFWVPGPVVVRPVWAPALVAWVGGGWGVSVGVAWFPLAPGEVFIPGYRVSRTYVNQVNITNTTVNITKVTNVYNITNVTNTTNVTRVNYANQHIFGGITAVSHETFVNARPVGTNVMKVEPRVLEGAPVGRVAPVEPIRQSVVGAGRPAPAKPPTAVMSRPVVAQRQPTPLPPTFEQRKAQAGGHLNQPAPLAPEPPAPRAGAPNTGAPNTGTPGNGGSNHAGPVPAQPREGFKPFAPPNHGNAGQGQGRPDVKPVESNGSADRGGNKTSVFDRPRNESNGGSPAKPEPSHPLVRLAPPVQQKSVEQERQQEQKFHNWDQGRPAGPVRTEARPAPTRPETKPGPEPKPAPKFEPPQKPKGH